MRALVHYRRNRSFMLFLAIMMCVFVCVCVCVCVCEYTLPTQHFFRRTKKHIIVVIIRQTSSTKRHTKVCVFMPNWYLFLR